MQNNISKSKPKHRFWFSRLLAITLAIATVTTAIPPIAAHASDVEDAAKNKGFGGVNPNPGTAGMGWYNHTQGYRIYVINPELERITPVYDFYFRNPNTFYKAVCTDGKVNYMRTTRFDSMPEDYYEDWGYGSNTIDVLVKWCSVQDKEGKIINEVTYPPHPYKSAKPYAGQGAEFKRWFYAGMESLTIDSNESKDKVVIDGVKDGETPTGKEPTPIPSGEPTPDPDICKTCLGNKITTMSCPNCKGHDQCAVCNNVGFFIIKCPTCNSDAINCNTCKDTKICMICCGTGRQTGTSLACPACKVTATCQICKSTSTSDYVPGVIPGAGIPSVIYKCTTCLGTGKLTCALCNGSKKSGVIFDFTSCDGCLGTGEVNCFKCTDKMNCSICNRDITVYGDYELSSGKCIECIKSYYIMNKCPECTNEVEIIDKSKNIFYCNICKKNISYNTSENTIKIYRPDSYWIPSSNLRTSTKTTIAVANSLINEIKDYSQGSYWWTNTVKLEKRRVGYTDSIEYLFNMKLEDDNEHPIHPKDALLYATGKFANSLYLTSDYKKMTSEEREATKYCIYIAMTAIQNSKAYQDLFYTISAIETASSNSNSNTVNSLLSTLIPLSGTDTTNKVIPAKNLIESGYIKFPNGEYKATDDKTAMQLAMEDGCLIIVEPLCGFRIKVGEENGEPLWGEYWGYGSFWNIAQHWYGDKESYYGSFLTNLTNNCLVTSKDFKTKAGYIIYAPVNPNRKIDIQESKKMMSSLALMYEKDQPIHGLSMHIYNYDISQTITFDESLENPDFIAQAGYENDCYAYLIGPSPDHTDLVAEEKYSDPTKYANIVKFYETTDPVTGETTYKIFTREKVPRAIEIVDEEIQTGYKLVEWYTTDKLCTDLSNPEITWEKLWQEEGFDRGNLGQHSIDYYSKHNTIICERADAYVMGKVSRVYTDIVKETEENTLYLLYRAGDSTTSTYDEELGDQIGPSPDDSDKLVERTDIESAVEGEKYTTTPATIVKIYEELNSKGEPISTEVFVREPVPNTIVIEDESEQTGYELQEWFTGSRYMKVKEEETYAELYKRYIELMIKTGYIYIDREVSIVGLDPDTPEYEKAYNELFKTLSFIEESGEETGEQVLYLHYTKSPTSFAVTSTYDEELKENPGPAPNNANRLTDEQIEAGEHVSIVKFYEYTNADGTVETQVFHRTKCPLVIGIQDESLPNADGTPRTGYEINEWFTSDQYDDTLTHGDQYDGFKSTVEVNNEGYHEQNVSFTDKVYFPGITLIGEEDLLEYGITLVEGTTLYIKLIPILIV